LLLPERCIFSSPYRFPRVTSSAGVPRQLSEFPLRAFSAFVLQINQRAPLLPSLLNIFLLRFPKTLGSSLAKGNPFPWRTGVGLPFFLPRSGSPVHTARQSGLFFSRSQVRGSLRSGRGLCFSFPPGIRPLTQGRFAWSFLSLLRFVLPVKKFWFF